MQVRGLKLALSLGSALIFFGGQGSAALAAPPTIESESVTSVTASGATLNARIDPHGLLTKYKLQIDTTGKFNFFQTDSCPLHPPGIFCAQVIVPGDPLPQGLVEPPEASLAAGTGSQAVSVNLASIGATLQPGTLYHYRAIAASSGGFAYGQEQTFITPPGHAQPSINREWATAVTEDSATLNAEINPGGRFTSFEFQIDGDGAYDYTQMGCPLPLPGSGQCAIIVLGQPLPEGLVEPEPESIPAGYDDRWVSVDLSSIGATLVPGATYHFRVIATNDGRIVYGPDQIFTAQSQADPPEAGEEEDESTAAPATSAPGIGATDAPAATVFPPVEPLPAQLRNRPLKTACKRKSPPRHHRRGDRRGCRSPASPAWGSGRRRWESRALSPR